MNSAFHNSLATHGAGLITHIALFNGSGVEISGGSYARQAVTWTGAAAVKSPSANLVFDIPAGANVASCAASRQAAAALTTAAPR